MTRMFDRDPTPPWQLFAFLLVIAIICVFLGTGCKRPDMPAVDVNFWAGDPIHQGITRKQENKTILASDPAFNEYACLTYLDIRKIFDTMLTCKQWGTPLMTHHEFKEMKQKNGEVLKNVGVQD